MKAKNNKGKPRFGIIVAATETPMGAAYKKALSSKQNKIAKAADPKDKITGADFKAIKSQSTNPPSPPTGTTSSVPKPPVTVPKKPQSKNPPSPPTGTSSSVPKPPAIKKKKNGSKKK